MNEWCRAHDLYPSERNNQISNDLSERILRYYRTIGLLDPPHAGGGRGYGEKHLLQLIALRILQAKGLPLRRIRELLHGRSEIELERIREEGILEHKAITPSACLPPPTSESWRMTPLHPDFLLLSRGDSTLAPETLAALKRILDSQTPSKAK